MKKYRLKLLNLNLLLIAVFVLISGCDYVTQSVKFAGKSRRNIEYSQNPVEITPYDYMPEANIDAQQKKAHTILIYMNGSDLESEYMSATKDIYEMIDSQFDEDSINVIIFTGGAKKWHMREIPNKDNAIFKLEDNKLVKLAQIGRDPMGYPETLGGFINFGYNLFPADKYGLIFWNHGGGAIVGYGSDERFANESKSTMKLSEIDSALKSNDLYSDGVKFDFIGFDTCLMATIEMACVAEKYADYLIASEELEPDDGWDYMFLGEITPEMTGMEAGILIADYYKNFYENLYNSYVEDILTISVTDLSKMSEVSDCFEKLAIAGRNEIAAGNYRLISKARSSHRSFGSRGEFSDETDMIDAANLAKSLESLFPAESGDLTEAINNAVVYKYEANIKELGGLSVYFPFANKKYLNYYIEIYKSINQLPEYVDFIESFTGVLDSSPFVSYRGVANEKLYRANNDNKDHKINLTPEQVDNLSAVYQTTWKKSKKSNKYIQISETKKVSIEEDGTVLMNFSDDCVVLNGNLVCLYESKPLADDGVRYSIPVKLNGKDADLIAVYCEKYPDGKIIGAVPASSEDIYNMLDKKIVKLRKGDKIQILYYSEAFGEYAETMNDGNNKNDEKKELWQKGKIFTVKKDDGIDLILSRELLESLEDGEYIYGLNFVDLQHNKYYSNFISAEIK